jgi:outer membrane immunogenic protein
MLGALIGFSGLQAASAADLPLKAPAFVAAPYNWGGLYVGENIGYGWGRNSDPDVTFFDGSGVGVAGYSAAGGNVMPNVQPKGLIGGAQVGYNWMLSPSIVVGLVADFQGSGMKASATNSVTPPGFVTTNQSNSVQTDWFGTARAKLGWAQNNWLLYATGGLAYGRVKTSGSWVAPATSFSYAGSDDATKIGWAVGAGLDYGLTRNWTIGAEYLYIDLGNSSHTMTTTNGFAQLTTFTVTNHVASQIARLTANYKF